MKIISTVGCVKLEIDKNYAIEYISKNWVQDYRLWVSSMFAKALSDFLCENRIMEICRNKKIKDQRECKGEDVDINNNVKEDMK